MMPKLSIGELVEICVLIPEVQHHEGWIGRIRTEMGAFKFPTEKDLVLSMQEMDSIDLESFLCGLEATLVQRTGVEIEIPVVVYDLTLNELLENVNQQLAQAVADP